MKRFWSVFLLIALILFTADLSFNAACRKITAQRITSRNVAVNRINSEINAAVSAGSSPGTIIQDNMGKWSELYGKDMPDDIVFVSADKNSGVFRTSAENSCAVCAVYGSDGDIAGFAEYTYRNASSDIVLAAGNIAFLVCFLLIAAAMTYIWFALILPFRKLSDYPERLAKLRDIQKLPESRSRFFGKYIWGMNMLSDVLTSSSNRIHMLEGEHQKLVTSIAHGVKTPVTNIRLYTDAVRSGIYTDKGMTDDIAEKIDRNAEKIADMAAELMAASEASFDGYDITPERFQVSELAELIRSEFEDRMAINRIPFSVVCRTHTYIDSDKYALYRAVSQLLENAVKYGDGKSIAVTFIKQDDGLCISVRNTGELLPENELPYVFRSYWRGSNAAEKPGSGIGLYVVHETMKALNGSVHVRRIEQTQEMEFVLYIND